MTVSRSACIDSQVKGQGHVVTKCASGVGSLCISMRLLGFSSFYCSSYCIQTAAHIELISSKLASLDLSAHACILRKLSRVSPKNKGVLFWNFVQRRPSGGPVAPISVNFNHQLAYFADQSDTTHVPHQPTAVA